MAFKADLRLVWIFRGNRTRVFLLGSPPNPDASTPLTRRMLRSLETFQRRQRTCAIAILGMVTEKLYPRLFSINTEITRTVSFRKCFHPQSTWGRLQPTVPEDHGGAAFKPPWEHFRRWRSDWFTYPSNRARLEQSVSVCIRLDVPIYMRTKLTKFTFGVFALV